MTGRNATGILPEGYRDPEIFEQHNQKRNPLLDLENPPVFTLDVDYSEGMSADWWPRGESPLLTELVEKAVLPPVEERVGPEPVVQRGFGGIGNYGGDWWTLATDVDQVRLMLQYVIANNTLVRFSPYGAPVRPHVARGVIPSEDYRIWTVHLRRGIRWSDGHPFTSEDIRFWWEHVANDPDNGFIPETLRVAGRSGNIEVIDRYTVRYEFPESHPGFLLDQASAAGSLYMAGPAHYLKQFHHRLGNRDLVERIAVRNRIRPENVLRERNSVMNPERPSLSPWILRTYRSNGPWTLVRNPYYFVVDEAGNQLPYLDRIVFRQVSEQLQEKTVMDGTASAVFAGASTNYTSLINQRASGNFEVRHWFSGGGGQLAIMPNRQLPVTPQDFSSAQRRELLRNPEFRRALSISIDRVRIIGAESMGVGEPVAPGPGPGEAGYDPEHLKVNVEYDLRRANEILDALGLHQRDSEGYRTLPDGSRLSFRLVAPAGGSIGTLQFVRSDWKRAGIRVVMQQRPHRLLLMERNRADFVIANNVTALGWESLGAGAPYFSWYHRGGLHGDPDATGLPAQPGELEIRLMQIGERARVTPDPEEQLELLREIMLHSREQVWMIPVLPPSAMRPQSLFVVKNGLKGVPDSLFATFNLGSPNNAAPESWYWEDPDTLNGEPVEPDFLRERAGAILNEIQNVTLPPRTLGADGEDVSGRSGITPGLVIQISIWMAITLFILLSAIRHPFVIKRLVTMVPTMGVISVIVFTGIQLPPGSYLDTHILNLEEQGLRAEAEIEIAQLEENFHLNDSKFKNYLRWSGLLWFFTYDRSDQGLLQGHMGYSMVNNRPVTELMGDRLLLTFLLSLGTILFTWIVAIPVGIYSAVKQYSAGDYVVTVIGFLGMCIPNFIFALVLMLLSRQWFDFTISGMFSSQFVMQEHWDWPKFVDLLKHLWIPVAVIGTAGTAGMIRVMRANLLDELKKPYVTTARAKGMRPLRLLFKYPVRLALNPFISGIGGILPALISGSAIVSIILSLPTVGPLLLQAVMIEDIYMAGSLLFILSLLSVIGVLISDLLLMALDPRIRMSGGSR
ncbi:MAG: ABC transporter permease subunit [Verrucomicrobia bacterium]|nr:ABC transporter permease subunit [Verrucomicrobiota bacterium]